MIDKHEHRKLIDKKYSMLARQFRRGVIDSRLFATRSGALLGAHKRPKAIKRGKYNSLPAYNVLKDKVYGQ